MKLAVVGSGISGLVVAWLLRNDHEVTVFEANDYLGGHTNTVDVSIEDERHAIDTGFIVFNDRTYPNFCRLLDRLGVSSSPTEMSFSVRCDRTGLEYNGSSISQLFAQRRNLLRWRFYRMLRDIIRFHRDAPRLLSFEHERITVNDYVSDRRFSKEFIDQYLVPMGAAIWSCPPETFRQFPMRFIVEFYSNHGLLSISNRPTWHVIDGGSRSYVERITSQLDGCIRLSTPVKKVTRHTEHVELCTRTGPSQKFDHVVFACHSDQALRMLADPMPIERELLSAFPYERNEAVLHTDTSVMPRRRRAWASWNYHLDSQSTPKATVTYDMNILQHIQSKHEFLVTLNESERISPSKVLRRFVYHHPVFTVDRKAAQERHAELIDHHRTSFCGAYWGNGFHEDGVNSALAVCRAFGKEL